MDFLVHYDAGGRPLGVVDFLAAEEAGVRLRGLCDFSDAVGAGAWPEWIADPQRYDVELQAGRIAALLRRDDGLRRDRRSIESEIERRRAGTPAGIPVDLRDLVGGPDRPLPG